MLICLQVMFFSAVPALAALPFQFTLHFYCRRHPLCSSEMAFLAHATVVRDLKKKWARRPWSQLIFIIRDTLVAPEREWNMPLTAAGIGIGCSRCQAPSILLGPSRIADGIPAPANHLWGKVDDQASDFLLSSGFSLIGTYLMFRTRSACHSQAFRGGPKRIFQT